jgi:hypothetical protein
MAPEAGSDNAKQDENQLQDEIAESQQPHAALA